ncbi:MAG: hypothetical protein SVE93_02815 [Candidatus Thermoplasmatota archaeon]|nr:hypothetical protein [Candidatus Thermoplasmatota archaeon]
MGIWDDYDDSKKKRSSLAIVLIALILFFSLVMYRAYDLKKRELDLKLRLNEVRVDSMDTRSATMDSGVLFHLFSFSDLLPDFHTLWDPLNQPL